MMKKRFNVGGKTTSENGGTTTTTSSSDCRDEDVEWEMRPGGMLVQKRTGTFDLPAPNIRLRVAYGALRFQISVNSQVTFGEVKKMMAEETGLQVGDQKVIFRGKERENGDYLDTCGVKDRSKVILMEDPVSIERRYIEMRRNAKIQTAHRAISDVATEVDQLAHQVSTMEKSISKGVKVAEVQITTLIEMLMRQAIKLSSISAEGDASALKNLQAKRVQKCVETLDALKISNARVKSVVVVTTKWETFDPNPHHPTPAHQWELFD